MIPVTKSVSLTLREIPRLNQISNGSLWMSVSSSQRSFVDKKKVSAPKLVSSINRLAKEKEEKEKLLLTEKKEKKERAKSLSSIRKMKNEEADRNKELLSNEQKSVIEIAKSGSSMFISGPGGTGKSFLLRQIVNELETKHGNGVYITASTGIAACNIEGITVHSFSGLGTGEGEIKDYDKFFAFKKEAKKRWITAKVLIIDEISMLSADLFEKLDTTARKLRGINKPFGGLQVLFCGDFFQLPPVITNRAFNHRKFCFESPLWKDSIEFNIELSNVFRHKDPEFRAMMNEFRWGRVSSKDVKALKTCLNKQTDGQIIPTKLYPYKVDVHNENLQHLENLKSASVLFKSVDYNMKDSPNIKGLSGIPEVLELKKDTQVVLLKNLDVKRGLVNGSRGVVTGFSEDKVSGICPVVKFSCGVEKKIKKEIFRSSVNGKSVPYRKQIPLNYGWALSVHKSQGMTLDQVSIDLKNIFEYGQAYVGLSRVTSMEGLYLNDFNEKVIKAHPKVKEFYEGFKPINLTCDEENETEKEGSLVQSHRNLDFLNLANDSIEMNEDEEEEIEKSVKVPKNIPRLTTRSAYSNTNFSFTKNGK